MKRNLVCMVIILGLISVGTSNALDNESTTDADLEKLNVTRTDDTNISRRLLSAVPGVDGRIIAQEPAKAVAGVEGGIVAQEPAPVNPAPKEEEKAACGPTLLIAIALLPLVLKSKFDG